MPNQVIPITGLDTVGLIQDSPAVSLPPNGFSDALNVRFKDNAAQKMEGEINILPNIFDGQDGELLYVAWWPNPNRAPLSGYYLYVVQVPDTMVTGQFNDEVYLVEPTEYTVSANNVTQQFVRHQVYTFTNSLAGQGDYQHTFFQGGFAVVLNNGRTTPIVIQDLDGNSVITDIPQARELPGWDSYNINESRFSGRYDEASQSDVFDLGEVFPYDMWNIYVRVSNGGTQTFENTFTAAAPGAVSGISVVQPDPDDPQITSVDFSGAADTIFNDGFDVEIRVRSVNPVTVTAGVVRSFGDFLVAGNLVERDSTDSAIVLRNLAGIVRSSDVAAPGSIPTNWNPFAAGVSTADEFIITADGVVQDIVELQGNLYLYSNSAISVMRNTGNVQVPLAVTPVTDAYGAQTTGAVLEFDGKHLVIGSYDIYLFGGHPGSIQSVSDARVRRAFFENLNALHEQHLFILRYQQRDEIWICYPTRDSISGECDLALIWNYRSNTWTQRELTGVVAGDTAPIPGGGIPATTVELTGDSGNNGITRLGAWETQTWEIPMDLSIPEVILDGSPAVSNLVVSSTFPDLDIVAPETFDVILTDDYFSGPAVFPGATTDTQSWDFSLVNSTTMTNVPISVSMPALLQIDRDWEADTLYPRGQRVVYNGVIYDVIRSLNTHMYGDQPNSDTDFYRNMADQHERTELMSDHIYVESQDDVTPDLATGFYSVAMDQTRRTLVYVRDQIVATLQANTDFAANFEIITTNVDGEIIIRGLTTPRDPHTAATFQVTERNRSNIGDANYLVPPNRPGGPMLPAGGFAPIINIVSRPLVYNIMAQEYAEQELENRDNTQIAAISIRGDFQAASFMTEDERLTHVAQTIRDEIHNAVTFGWDAETATSPTLVNTAENNGPRTLRFANNMNLEPMGFIDGEDVNGVAITIPTTALTFELQHTGTDALTEAEIDYPRICINAPDIDGANTITELFLSGTAARSATDIMDAIIARALEVDSAWTETLEGGYTQLTDHQRIIQADTQRPTGGVWEVRLISRGNSGITEHSFDFSFTVTRNFAGQYEVRATPTYFTILVRNSSVEGNRQMIVTELGEAGDYMIDDQSGTNNGLSRTAEESAQEVISRVRILNPRLAVERQSATTFNPFSILPANYSDLANFVLEININDTQAGVDRINQLREQLPEEAITGDTFFINEGEENVALHSRAVGIIVVDGETQANPDPARRPDRTMVRESPTVPTLRNAGAAPIVIFDVLRPWDEFRVNPNQEYPILATALTVGQTVVNKIVAADIGWSRPLYTTIARVSSLNPDTARAEIEIMENTNDFPQPYTSYIERKQLAITPEFDTEQVQSIALHATGQTEEYFDGPIRYNKLLVRMEGTNAPGEGVDLSMEMDTDQSQRQNDFFISEDYKVDMRVHGRFVNLRITDDAFIDAAMSETQEDKTFNKQSEWRISMIQADIVKGGTR